MLVKHFSLVLGTGHLLPTCGKPAAQPRAAAKALLIPNLNAHVGAARGFCSSNENTHFLKTNICFEAVKEKWLSPVASAHFLLIFPEVFPNINYPDLQLMTA